MRRFKKKPELSFIVIPGLGRISDDRVLEGDQFAKFCPSILVELPGAAPAVTVPAPRASPKALPKVIVPPPPPPSPAHTPDALADTTETPIHIPPEAIPPKPSAPHRPSTMEDAGFVSPEKLVAAVDAENRQTEEQIEKAVERLAPADEKKTSKPLPKPTPHHKSSGKKPSGRK